MGTAEEHKNKVCELWQNIDLKGLRLEAEKWILQKKL